MATTRPRRVRPSASTERAPRPGELCTCGRLAVTMHVTEKFGDVGYCGIPDGGLNGIEVTS